MTKLLMAVAAAAALAGCGNNESASSAPQGTTGASSAGASRSVTTETTPANAGTPTRAEKREGGNPQQGQVDPKESEQRKDFQQRGDSAGPTSAETKPRD